MTVHLSSQMYKIMGINEFMQHLSPENTCYLRCLYQSMIICCIRLNARSLVWVALFPFCLTLYFHSFKMIENPIRFGESCLQYKLRNLFDYIVNVFVIRTSMAEFLHISSKFVWLSRSSSALIWCFQFVLLLIFYDHKEANAYHSHHSNYKWGWSVNVKLLCNPKNRNENKINKCFKRNISILSTGQL